MNKINVLIVDDHPMLREALRGAIETEVDMQVLAEAANGRQGVERALSLHPDVIVMDLYLPILDGIAAIKEIIASDPKARILAITSSTDDERVVGAVQAGAKGYLLKDASGEQFLTAIREVAAGETSLSREVSEKLARGLHLQASNLNRQADAALTQRELEVLKIIGEGLNNHAIAKALNLSESTVRVHVYNILNKLNLSDRSQAVMYALKHCQIPPLTT